MGPDTPDSQTAEENEPGYTPPKSLEERALRSKLNFAWVAVTLMIVLVVAVVIIAVLYATASESGTTPPPVTTPACAPGPIEQVAVKSQAMLPATDCPDVLDKLSLLTLPAGFSISVFACGLDAPRSIDVGANGEVYVGTRAFNRNTSVHVLKDLNQDGVADEMLTIDLAMDQPNGVVYLDGSLYVADANRLIQYQDIDALVTGSGATAVARQVLNQHAFPEVSDLEWHYLATDGTDIYATSSGGCDHCMPSDSQSAAIAKFAPQPCATAKLVASGIRFSVGLDFTKDGTLWFTNNAHDTEFGSTPEDSLTSMRLGAVVPDFGFPYCHCASTGLLNNSNSFEQSAAQIDYSHGNKTLTDCATFAPCELGLGQSVAPLGLAVCRRDLHPEFPSAFCDGAIFVAERGAFGASPPAGYQVVLARPDELTAEDFVTGFLNKTTGTSWGRPVDVTHWNDGTLLISDDKANAIYRVTWD